MVTPQEIDTQRKLLITEFAVLELRLAQKDVSITETARCLEILIQMIGLSKKA